MLAWRVLAAIAAPVRARQSSSTCARKTGRRPARPIAGYAGQRNDVFSLSAWRYRSGSADLGAGFSLRLARAEARAAGGELSRDDQWLILSLPLLTGEEALPSPANTPGRAAG